MVRVSTNPVQYGECIECGNKQRVTAGAIGDVVERGEEFDSKYCCPDCLEEHGATTHVRVSRSEV